MSEEQEPTFYLTSREVESLDRLSAEIEGYGIFGKYDEETLLAVVEKLRGKKVFYVDDEPRMFDFIPDQLRRGGAEVTVFESAEEALKAMEEKRPDVVVSDMNLGHGMDGWEFAKKWGGLVSS